MCCNKSGKSHFTAMMFFAGLAAGFLLAPIRKGVTVSITNNSGRMPAPTVPEEPLDKKPEPVPIRKISKDEKADPETESEV